MAETKSERFRAVVLDDYEGQADKVPAYRKLKQRAEVKILRERLESEVNFGRAMQGVNALLLMRERPRFDEKQLALAPALIFSVLRRLPEVDRRMRRER